MNHTIFDTHAHLLDNVYDEIVEGNISLSNDGPTQSATLRREILVRAQKEGLYIIESALNEKEWQDASSLADSCDNLFFTIGIHPHNAEEYGSGLSWLKTMKEIFNKKHKCLAVGETGLDYHYKNSSPDKQKEIFKLQIEVALELSKPIVIHCRQAYEDCFNILKSYSDLWRGVIHCFSGGVEEAEMFLALGFYLGITCPVTYPKSDKLKRVVNSTPLDRLLTETDSPYLPPAHLRGKRNEPANVRYVVEEIARIKNLSYEYVASVTSANARQLFGIK